VTSLEMRIIDRNSDALGVSTLLLMENAGRSIADVVEEVLGGCRGKKIAVFAGAGGKAGDGITAARHLASRGARVVLFMLTHPKRIEHEATRIQYEAVEKMDLSIKIRIVRDVEDLPQSIEEFDAVIDALLGIGIRGRVRNLYAKAIELINSFRGPIIAIDVPSGIDPDTGEVLGTAVRATITVTLHKAKPGLLKARDYVGQLRVVSIGVPPEAEIYVGPGDVEYRVRPRPLKAHKGVGGRVLIVGGSHTFTGAPALAALAALRTGADLAYVAAPERVADIIASYSPNIIAIRLRGSDILVPEHVEQLTQWIERCDTLVIGPGLGLDPRTFEAVYAVIERARALGKRMVIDADALKALAERRDLLGKDMVVTPHAGEFRRLFGIDVEESIEGRIRAAVEAAKRFNTVVLLKGWLDVISDGERYRLNKVHVQSMSVGGTGDVLSGIIAALMARGLSPFDAACVGAFINGLAGCIAYAELGDHITATDLIERIPEAMNRPYENFRKYLVYKRLS